LKTHLKDRARIFKQPAYSRYFIAAIMATLAFGLTYISNTWFVVSLDHELNAILWSFLAYWLPNAFFSPFAGAIVDRLNRKYVAGFGFMAFGLCYGGFGILVYFIPSLHLYWIYIIYFIMGVLSAFFMPGLMAFIREIISKKDLLYANANLDLGYQMGSICGIGLAGYMVHYFGFAGSYWAAAGLFIISGSLVLSISDKYRIRRKVKPSTSGIFRQFLDDTKSGYNYAISNKPRLVLYVSQLSLLVILMTTPVLLAPFVKTVLHAEAIDLSHIEVSMTVGTILGGILLIYLAQKAGFILVLLLSIALLVVSILVFSMIDTVMMAMICYFCIGFSLGSWSILISRAQELTDPAYQGRVQSLFGSVTSLLIVILYLSLSLITLEFTISHIYWVISAFAIVPIIFILKVPKYFRD
jgi:MFS transporter, DHA3 family, macrolide efflux protein